MKLLKKTALATAIAFTAILPMVESAEAAPRSYFSYVDNYARYPEIQINFVNSMITNYTRTVSVFNSLVDRYARFSGASWYTNIVVQRDWYVAELAKYENKLAELTGSTPEVVTVVNTEVTTTVNYEQLKSAPVEIESYENIVEETIDNMVYVYSVLTAVLQTEITTKELTTTTTITYYSDNTTKSESTTSVTNTEVRYETENVVSRELIDQYAVVTPGEDGEGTKTLNILTLEEYNAREDVNYAGSRAFADAMQKGGKWWMYDSYILNPEGQYYLYGNNLDVVNAPEAWARGWTGEGTKIAILDSGIDTDHVEFEGKIVGTKCFAYCDGTDDVEDLNGHGTHVAGIAAGALDGNGSTGVAYDADLLVAKVTNSSGVYDLIGAAEALRWAENEGATVANMSGGITMSSAYVDALTQVGAGEYQLVDHGADNTEYQQILLDGNWSKYGIFNTLRAKYDFDALKVMMENFTDSELVAVIAAGNDGQKVAGFPAHYAMLADKNGDLVFDGRIIVAGSYDQQNQELAYYSNAAGTVCVDTPDDGTSIGGNTCDNTDLRVKDFYLMAPGSYVMSADIDGGYVTKTGTSMAAPTISGGVAIIHQMWPHMTGSNLVQVLLRTANKNIPDYDENVHGQGLMDLEAATRPLGELGIPTSGRAEGKNLPIYGGMQFGAAATSLSALEEVMIVDEYDRDFYFNANSMVERVDTRTMSYTVAHKDKINTNAYAGYGATQNAGTENMLIGASSDLKSLNVAYDFDNGVSVGYLREEGTFLGNTAKSSLMKVDGAQTVYMGYNAEKEAGSLTIFGGATVAFTKADVDSSAMMKSMDTLVSNTANIGAELALNDTSSIGLVTSLPVAITSGSANFKAAQSISDNGDINYANVSSSLAADAREYNIGAYYNFNEAKNYGDVEVSAFVEERINYLGQSGESDTAGGIKLKIRF